MDNDRIVDREAIEAERSFEQTLRPQRLDEFVGQSRIKDNLSVFIRAAAQRGEPLDHVLLFGPPGLGKTTLAQVIGREMDAPVRISSGPAIEKTGDLAAILTTLQEGEILFLDEIHRLGRALEEILYPAMEDRSLDLVIGSGPGALRDRFGIVHHLDYSGAEELTRIAMRSAGILGIELSPDGAKELARRSRGTPRIVNRLLRRVRDFAQVAGEAVISAAGAARSLERLEVDRYGLDQVDRRMLHAILTKVDGGPVGLATLAATVGEDAGTIEEIYEPYLLQIGFLDRTPRGRRATRLAHDHLIPHRPDGHLF